MKPKQKEVRKQASQDEGKMRVKDEEEERKGSKGRVGRSEEEERRKRMKV